MLKARTNMMLMRMLVLMRKVMLVGVADLLTFRNPNKWATIAWSRHTPT